MIWKIVASIAGLALLSFLICRGIECAIEYSVAEDSPVSEEVAVPEQLEALDTRIRNLEAILQTEPEKVIVPEILYYGDFPITVYEKEMSLTHYHNIDAIAEKLQLVLDYLKLEYKPKEECEKPARLEKKEHVL